MRTTGRPAILLQGMWEARLVWFTIGVILGAMILALWLKGELAIRLIGLGLQLLGTGTVIVNIQNKRKKYNLPGPLKRVAKFFRQLIRPSYLVSYEVGVPVESRVDGRADTWHSATDTTPEARLTALERNLLCIRQGFTQFEQGIGENLRQLAEGIDREKQERAKDDKHIMKELKSLEVGDLSISAAGVTWLIVGTVLSTMSIEVAYLLTPQRAQIEVWLPRMIMSSPSGSAADLMLPQQIEIRLPARRKPPRDLP
jgi:hypothetical protein